MLTLYDKLARIDVNNYRTVLSKILQIIISGFGNIRFASILIYNDSFDTIIYQEIECDELKENGFDKNCLAELLKMNIILKVEDSVSGKLIRSSDNVMIIDNVLEEINYQSKDLAELLGLKQGVFMKISSIRTEKVYGIIALYPRDKEFTEKYNRDDLQTLIRLVGNVILTANLIREDKLFYAIFDAALKAAQKNLESFLSICVRIISDEIQAKGCSIFLVDPSDNLIKLKASLKGVKPGPGRTDLEVNPQMSDVYYKMGEGITGEIVEKKRVHVSNDVDLSESKWIDIESSKTFVGVPILDIDENKSIGVIRCTTKPNNLLGSVECFNQEDVDLLKYVAKVIGKFMEVYFYRENVNQLLTKMPHELSASLRNIYSICEYIELMNRKGIGIAPYYINMKINDIKDEVNLSMMTVNSVAIFDQNIAEYDFEYIDIFADIIPRTKKYLVPDRKVFFL